jgi:hypothetical protein
MMARLTVLLVAVCILAGLAAEAAAADSPKYACYCKGIKEWVLFVPTYGDCGNGFTGGDQGNLVKDLGKGRLGTYIPPGVQSLIDSPANCGYYPDSGWNCGQMFKTGGVPPCLSE